MRLAVVGPGYGEGRTTTSTTTISSATSAATTIHPEKANHEEKWDSHVKQRRVAAQAG